MSNNRTNVDDSILFNAIDIAHSLKRELKKQPVGSKHYLKDTFEYSNSDFEDDDDHFKNPLGAPVEMVNLSKGNGLDKRKVDSVPAISHHWIKDWIYGEYSEDISRDDICRLIEGFKWLLNLKVYKFWSQVIYEPNTVKAIKSFIIVKRCSSISTKTQNDKTLNKLYNEIYWLVYRILQQLTHSKTSKSQSLYWLFQQHHFHTHKFFSEEILLGICGLYGNTYPHSVQILLEKIFDADSTLSTIGISELAKNTQSGLNIIHCVHMKQWFTYILNTKNDESPLSTIYNVTLSLLQYIEEFLNERRVLMQLYPSSIQWFQNYGIDKLLCWFYDTDMSYVNNVLSDMDVNNIDIGKERYRFICRKMYDTCQEIVQMYRLMLLNLVHCAGFDKNKKNDKLFSEKYLELLSQIVKHTKFGKHYVMEYDAREDIKIVPQVFSTVNQQNLSELQSKIEDLIDKDVTNPDQSSESENKFFKLHYDLQTNPVFKHQFKDKGIRSLDACRMLIKINSIGTDEKQEITTVREETPDDDEAVLTAIAASLNTETAPFCDQTVYDAVFESLVTEVKSILPHLGEGFISECLKYYNNNSQEVITAILEENLPPQLMLLDQGTPLIPEDPIEKLAEARGHNRRNVFDGDEFDKMTVETFDPKRVFRKKNKYDFKDLKAMLDDKSYVREMADKYTTYSCDMYDDDYDDLGCEYQVVIGNDLTADEVENKFEHPSRASRFNKNHESSDSSDSDETEEQKPTNAFCEDPALIRERAEARRAQKYNNRRGGGGAKVNQPPDRDVVGKPKGQGQDKTVLQNRDHKNVRKSSRANHNRRSGAQWKRSKGMIPS